MLRIVNRTALIVVFCQLVLSACSGAEQSSNHETAQNISRQAAGISDLAEGWQLFEPGGDTACSDGSPYRFSVRKGDPSKLMVFFQGGGACWQRQNCDAALKPTYTQRVNADFEPPPSGIFNFDHPQNPFSDYSIVMAPYCSGDVHLGASNTVYPALDASQSDLVIHHQGRANAQAVLDWTFANVPDPQQVFVTGSSAGAIPSPLYASIIANHYPSARVAQLGDGAGGYRRINADARPDEQWGTFTFLTQEAGFEGLSPETFTYEALYIAAAQAHPSILFAQYDAAEDAVQKQFLALGGQTDVALLPALDANHADIQRAVPNFRSFVSGGATHTILRKPEFYQFGVDGRSIRDWVADLAEFKTVSDVRCQQCAQDTYATGAPPVDDQG